MNKLSGAGQAGPRRHAAPSPEEERSQALRSALQALGRMARSRWQVERLLMRKYAADVVQEVLAYLSTKGWLDDLAFARQYVAGRPDRGPRRLASELLRKGVSPAIIEMAVREASGAEDPVEVARSLAARRLSRMAGLDRQSAWRRLAGYLSRRGYENDTISTALHPLLQGLPAASRRVGKFSRIAPEEE